MTRYLSSLHFGACLAGLESSAFPAIKRIAMRVAILLCSISPGATLASIIREEVELGLIVVSIPKLHHELSLQRARYDVKYVAPFPELPWPSQMSGIEEISVEIAFNSGAVFEAVLRPRGACGESSALGSRAQELSGRACLVMSDDTVVSIDYTVSSEHPLSEHEMQYVDMMVIRSALRPELEVRNLVSGSEGRL